MDLGCGPGSLGDRLADRLPGAEIVGLDYDPVLLALAQVLHANDPDRSWIELDMRQHDWVDYLEGRQFDAVVSTTALHWLGAPNLMRVYQDLTRVLAPGGVFVNGDICSYDQTQPTLRRMANRRLSLLGPRPRIFCYLIYLCPTSTASKYAQR